MMLRLNSRKFRSPPPLHLLCQESLLLAPPLHAVINPVPNLVLLIHLSPDHREEVVGVAGAELEVAAVVAVMGAVADMGVVVFLLLPLPVREAQEAVVVVEILLRVPVHSRTRTRTS